MKKLSSLLIFVTIFFWSSFAQDKPNILWITIEDTSPQFIGCYGNNDASTPNIDQLAEGGVRFTNAFSTGTVCSPSRSTIITGVRTFKMGTGNHRSNYNIPNYIHGFPYFLKKEGYYVTNNWKTDYNVGNEQEFIQNAWDESSGKAGWWNRKPGQPFFAVFNYMESHQSRTMTHPYDWYLKHVLEKLTPDERIAENDFDVPPFYRDTPEMRKQLARVYNSIKLTDKRIGELLQKLEQDNLRDSTIIFFFADHGEGIPRGKTNGIDLGYRVPFIIWFPDRYKHLSPWGTGGIVTEELISFEDLAPTIISLAGGEIPDYLEGRVLLGKKRSRPVNHLLLSSDRADNGPDLVRNITDGKYIYCRNFMPFMPQLRYIRYVNIADITQIMRNDFSNNLLDPFQASIFMDRPAEFLFDTESDRWETTNLVDNPKYKGVLKKMRKQLEKGILKARDVHFLPEYEIDIISKQGITPYEYRLNDKIYPFRAIYGAASLSGLRGRDIARKQIDLLDHENKIVRYWAMVGLRCQPSDVLRLYEKEILEALDDTYPPVAITAAAVVYQHFKSTRSEQMLKEYCQNQNPHLALMAINYLLYIDPKMPFVETVKQVYEMPDRIYNVKAACLDFLGAVGMVPNNYQYRE